jgi:hypothetical protein
VSLAKNLHSAHTAGRNSCLSRDCYKRATTTTHFFRRSALFLLGRAKTARVLPQPEPFRAFNSDDLSRFGLLSPDDREIDLGIKGDVEIVREDVDRHVRDDFTNLCLSKPGLLCLHQIGITDVSAFLQ